MLRYLIRRLQPCVLSTFFLLSAFITSQASASGVDNYLIGVGKWDITGAAAEIGMMGYADTEQKSSGTHMRQYARAFIVAEPGGKRVVFVNVDAGQLFQSVK